MKPRHNTFRPALRTLCAAAMLCAIAAPAASALAAPAPVPTASIPVFRQLDPGRVQLPDDKGVRNSGTQMSDSLDGDTARPVAPVVQDGQAVAPDAAAMPFTVEHVTLEGVTRYPADTFRPLLDTLENRPVTLAEANEVARQVTARYRADGYLLVRTFVPAQTIDHGTLKIEVVEGRLNHVTVTGHDSAALDRFAKNLGDEVPLTAATLERNLLLMNDLPGHAARAVLVPSEGEEGTDIVIDNENFRRVEGFAGIDNRSGRYFGPWQVYGGVGINDPLGLGDRLSVRGGTSIDGRKMNFYEGQYEVPIGSDGAALSLLAQHNDGRADVPAFLNANSQGTTVAARIAYPIIRSREQTLKVSGALTAFDGKSVYLDDPSLPPSTNDRIRALRVGASYDFIDNQGGRNLLKGELSHGLDGLGASPQDRPNASRPAGRTDFTKLQLDAQRIQDLSAIADGLQLYLAATGQTSFGQPLLAPEQFGVGGNFFGRGYDPSEITGDSGIAGKVELQYNRIHKVADHAVPTQYYAFWDIGKVWNSQPYYIRSASLASAGVGAHFTVAKNLFISPEIAFPLTRPVTATEINGGNGKAPRFYLNVLKLF